MVGPDLTELAWRASDVEILAQGTESHASLNFTSCILLTGSSGGTLNGSLRISSLKLRGASKSSGVNIEETADRRGYPPDRRFVTPVMNYFAANRRLVPETTSR